MQGQGLGVLLSHHRDDQLHLCYRLSLGRRTLHLCARCAGLYPALALTLVAGRLGPVWPWWLEWGLMFLAPLPALVEWGTTVATGRPDRANPVRTLTGLGLGVGLGANLVVNTRELAGPAVSAQLLFFLASVWVVWLISYARRSRARRAQASAGSGPRPSLEEFLARELGPPRSPAGPTVGAGRRGESADVDHPGP
jgi:uncharacterized membrane protein